MTNKVMLKEAISSDKFRSVWDSLPMSHCHVLSPTEALQELDNLIGNKCILPEHAWLINYEPFKALHSNHVIITRENTRGTVVVMVTRLDDDVEAISFGSVTTLKIGLEYRLDFYCHSDYVKIDTGLQLLKTHLLRHLILLNQGECDKQLIVDVVMPIEMDPELLNECYQSVGLTSYSPLEKTEVNFAEKMITRPNLSGKL